VGRANSFRDERLLNSYRLHDPDVDQSKCKILNETSRDHSRKDFTAEKFKQIHDDKVTLKSYVQHNRLKIRDYSKRKEILDLTSEKERNHNKSLMDFLSPRPTVTRFRPDLNVSGGTTLRMSDIQIQNQNQSRFNSPNPRFEMSGMSVNKKLRSISKELSKSKMSTRVKTKETPQIYVLENRWKPGSQNKAQLQERAKLFKKAGTA